MSSNIEKLIGLLQPEGRYDTLFTILGGAGVALAIWNAMSAVDISQDTVNQKASTETVAVVDRLTMGLYSYVEPSAGLAVKDYSVQPDAIAHQRGWYVQNVEYVAQAPMQYRAIDDPDIGFYFEMVESDGVNDYDIDPSRVRVWSPDPVSCSFDEGYSLGDLGDGCEQIIDVVDGGVFKGAQDTVLLEGGLLLNRRDETLNDAIVANESISENNYCEIGVRYGTEGIDGPYNYVDGNLIHLDYDGITAQSTTRGVYQDIISRYRRLGSEREGVPMTNEFGISIFLTPQEAEIMRQITIDLRAQLSTLGQTDTDKPLFELADINTIQTMIDAYGVFEYQGSSLVDLNQNPALELLQKKQDRKEIDINYHYPMRGEDGKVIELTEENYLNSPLGIACMDTEYEMVTYRPDRLARETIAEGVMPPFAELIYAYVSNEDVTTERNGNLVPITPMVVPGDVAQSRQDLIRYKLSNGFELTDAEIIFVNEQKAKAKNG